MSLGTIRLALTVFAVFMVYLVPAQLKQPEQSLIIRGKTIPLAENAVAWLDSVAKAETSGPIQVLLHFYQLPDEGVKRRLAASGVDLLDYLPQNAYTAILNLPLKDLDPAATFLRSIRPLSPEWKMDERLLQSLRKRGSGNITVLVSFVRGTVTAKAGMILGQLGGRVTDDRFAPVSSFVAELPAAAVDQLAALPLVRYMGLPALPEPLNFDARSSSGANLLGSPAATGGYLLDGKGVTLGVGDNTSAIWHVDARDRITNFNPAGPTMHGVHTTTTAAGNGTMDPRMVGLAPAARIMAHIYDVVWAQTPTMFTDYGMTLTNNSYAAVVGDSSFAGTYDQYAQMLDEYEQTYPFVQHMFSSGNDGLLQYAPFPASYRTVTGGYQPAKNVLTVGAMAKDNIIWPKSSGGPVKDGRLKPEIMAYGFGIHSGDIFDNYGNSNGTSMSCPVVTGGLALIAQRFKQLHGGQNPRGSLLKALAMNGATDMGNPGPDFLHGYGLLNLYRSIQMLDNNRYLIDSLPHGNISSYQVSVPPNTATLKLMLYWHDDPASPLAPRTLVNNLDLEVSEPGGGLRRPLILDPAPTGVTSPATEGVDNLNNSEQIVIHNPPAGNYSVRVRGTTIPAGVQEYVLVYDFVPVGVHLSFPAAGTAVPGNDSVRVYWEASDDPNTFTLEYSTNNGGNWTIISSAIPPGSRQYVWYPPNLSTSQALMRISRNNTGQSFTTGPFVINPQPMVQLSPVQCPGYMAIEWNNLPGVTSYEVLFKIGEALRPVDTVSATSYVFSGLSFDSLYFAGVRPLINGASGWRSKSVKRMPNDGTCTGSISDGDLVLDSVLAPRTGRELTATALSSNETLSLRIRNLDDIAAGSYVISYRVNGGPWQTHAVTTGIGALDSDTLNITGFNLANTGLYKLELALTNTDLSDPVPANDTVVHFVKHLYNSPVDIDASLSEGFESTTMFTVLRDTMGLFPGDHWDYTNSTDSGRLRSYVSRDVLIGGDRSLSLDLQMNKADNQNYLTGTFNLSAYQTASTEARLEFDYKIHGQPKFLDGNAVWVRGTDTDNWLPLYTIDTSADPGSIINTGSLSVTAALAAGGQEFSSSFQVRIGQRDTSVIALNEYGNGMTLDNFRFYSVRNDVQAIRIVSPKRFYCNGVGDSLRVLIYNSDNLPQDTVELFYRLDNGPVVTDTLFFIAAKDSVLYTFPAIVDISAKGAHVLDFWIRTQGDNYPLNDSILNYRFRNQPDIATFPYLEHFEAGDGDWYTGGNNSSWQYGVPASNRLQQAASGTKVWATNLTGNYSDNELAFLYSPCFDISGLANPMLSFSLNTDIEDCGGVLCDAAYVEYSADGETWTKLGAQGEGYNWYGQHQAWHTSQPQWRVATIPLPKDVPSIKLRFVLRADPGTVRDGIAIDDIHIFDKDLAIYSGPTVKASGTTSNGMTRFTAGDGILAEVSGLTNPEGSSATMYRHTYVLNPVARVYHVNRNYVLQLGSVPDSVELRLFVTDEEIQNMLRDTECDTCARPADPYRLGLMRYDDNEESRENGSLSDNHPSGYTFIPYTAIRWVPYDNGYYAATIVKSLSEFWFSNGRPVIPAGLARIYPNPVTGRRIHIVWHAAPGTPLQFVLSDLAGRLVCDIRAEATGYDSHTVLELPDLEPGVYIARYTLGNEVHTEKLLIRR